MESQGVGVGREGRLRRQTTTQTLSRFANVRWQYGFSVAHLGHQFSGLLPPLGCQPEAPGDDKPGGSPTADVH